jgi:lysophospholipase L1-like esterase
MKSALLGALAALALTAGAVSAESNAADSQPAAPIVVARNWPLQMPSEAPRMSNECATRTVAGDAFRRPLRGLRRALRAKREPKVLAVGSSSTVGVGASSPSAAYIAKLETNLEGSFKGLDFEVVGRGMSGEVAEGQSARMKREIEEHRPDLVIWQVGTNDALRHVDVETFKSCLRRTLAWFNEQRIDVVLIDPQYGDKLNEDAYYAEIVSALAEVAKEMRVLLVDRFEAMRELSKARGDSFYLTSDNLHLNDAGHRCMAEQLARAIVSGVLLAETESVQAAQ